MLSALHVTVRNELGEVVEYHCGSSVLQIDVPEGRYVITVMNEATDCGPAGVPVFGTLQ